MKPYITKWWLSVAVYFAVLLVLCCFLPFSKVFMLTHSKDSLFDLVDKVTEARYRSAEQYFHGQDPEYSSKIYSERLKRGSIFFAIGIITVRRMKESEGHESLGYLPPSVAQMDKILKSHPYFNTSVLFICNVDTFPSTHYDAINLYKFVPYTERFGNNSLGTMPLKIPKTTKNFIDVITHSTKYNKETYDYTFCLLSAASLNPQSILLLEEDIIPHNNFPDVLEHVLKFTLPLQDDKQEFGYLKLFFPLKWQGFAFEFTKLLDLVSWSILGTTTIGGIYYFYFLRSIPLQNINTIILSVFLVTLVTCLLVGRQNINEFRRLSKHFYRVKSSEGCCTQAMVYSPAIVGPLSEHLVSASSNKHTDLAILDFSHSHSFRTLQVEPNLFYHTGLYTTLEEAQKHPEEFVFTY